MQIKKGDNVIIIAGKDRGKTGKVARAFPGEGRVVIEGVNMAKRHQKPRKQGTKGQVVEVAMPLHISNVMIVDPKTGKRSRIGKKLVGGKYIRVSKKSGIEI
ncbi:MAG: 50S ribosomal protein L24 [Patescibacteria group bacterium]